MTLRLTRTRLVLALACALAIVACLASVALPAFAHTNGPAHGSTFTDQPFAVVAVGTTSQQLRVLGAGLLAPLTPAARASSYAAPAAAVVMTAALLGCFAIPLRI